MESSRIAKRVCDGECMGSHLLDRPRKKWIDWLKDARRILDVEKVRRMGDDRNEWWGVCEGNAWGLAKRRNP